jgi:MFS family permease
MIPPLLRRPAGFRSFWIGHTVSLFGDQISLIAVPLAAVLILHADAAEMGYLTAAMVAPSLFFSLHLGAWIDRRGRRRQAMIAADLGRAALLASIPAAYAAGVLTFAQLLIVGFLVGTLSVVFYVAHPTLFTALVPRECYVEANQLLHGSRAFSFVAGPSIGGVLVQFLSAPFAIVADAVSYLVSARFLGHISTSEPPTEQAERGHLMAGARFIRRTPLLLASLMSTATINLFNFVFFALFMLYATETLHVRPGILGIVLGAGAIGGLIGSILTGRITRRLGIGPAFVAGSLLFPAPLLLVPLADGPEPLVLALLFLAEFGSGFGVMLLDITLGSIQQALTPDRLRARVSGAYMVVNFGVRPFGALLGGALGTLIGLRPALWIATIGATLGVLFLLPSPAPRLRTLPEIAD